MNVLPGKGIDFNHFVIPFKSIARARFMCNVDDSTILQCALYRVRERGSDSQDGNRNGEEGVNLQPLTHNMKWNTEIAFLQACKDGRTKKTFEINIIYLLLLRLHSHAYRTHYH